MCVYLWIVGFNIGSFLFGVFFLDCQTAILKNFQLYSISYCLESRLDPAPEMIFSRYHLFPVKVTLQCFMYNMSVHTLCHPF